MNFARSVVRAVEEGAEGTGQASGAGDATGANGTVVAQSAGSPGASPGTNNDTDAVEAQGAGAGEGGQTPADDSEGIDELAERHAGYLEGFDPTIHATDKSGSPILTKSGAFAKRRGRKATADSAPVASVSAVPSAPQTTNAPLIDDAPASAAMTAAKLDAAAAMSTNLLFNLSVNFFGPEWEPTKDEPKMIKTAFRDYYAANGYVDLPPGAALVLAIGIYALPRFKHENTRTKIARIWGGIKNALANLRGN